MEPITLNFQLTPEDFRTFMRYVVKKNFRSGRGILLFTIALLLIGGAMFFKNSEPPAQAAPTGSENSLFAAAALSLMPIAILIAVLFFLRKQVTKKTLEYNQDVFLPRILRITNEGVYSENATSSSMHKWAGVCSLDESKAYYFMMIAPNRGFIVPKRCFATPEDDATFGKTVRAFLEKQAG